MTNEQILEKQVEALEKLLQLRSAIIEELEAKVNKLESEKFTLNPQVPGVNIPWMQPYQPFIGGGSLQINPNAFNCPDGTPHDYPSMWGGTQPPACQKCGHSSDFTTTITCQNGGNVPVHTSGYMQPCDAGSVNNIFTLKSIAK